MELTKKERCDLSPAPIQYLNIWLKLAFMHSD